MNARGKGKLESHVWGGMWKPSTDWTRATPWIFGERGGHDQLWRKLTVGVAYGWPQSWGGRLRRQVQLRGESFYDRIRRY